MVGVCGGLLLCVFVFLLFVCFVFSQTFILSCLCSTALFLFVA